MNSHEQQQRPQVNLTPPRIICGIHGEPFRANWPSGYPIFFAVAMDKVVKSEAFLLDTDGKVENFEAALDAKPLCCRLKESNELLPTLLYVQEQAKVWGVVACSLCGKRSLGFVMRTLNFWKRAKMRDVCLECLATRIVPRQRRGSR